MLKTIIVLTQDYKDLIYNKNNETIVQEIMNDSIELFPNKYDNIESTFECLETGYLYDLKILFFQEMCKFLSANKINIWSELMRNAIDEVYECLIYDIDFSNTILYKEMLYRFNNIEKDENCILFFPFPVTFDFKESFINYACIDIFQMIYLDIVEKMPYLIYKDVYIIYPNLENKTIISKLGHNKKEFLDRDYFSKYIRVTNFE